MDLKTKIQVPCGKAEIRCRKKGPETWKAESSSKQR